MPEITPALAVIQVLIALGIANVWLLRPARPSPWRGGRASTLREEFSVYGLPEWTMLLVGFLKLSLAAVLMVRVWYPALARPAAAGIALLMLGAVLMHLKVRDPARRAVPALTMLSLSLVVVLA